MSLFKKTPDTDALAAKQAEIQKAEALLSKIDVDITLADNLEFEAANSAIITELEGLIELERATADDAVRLESIKAKLQAHRETVETLKRKRDGVQRIIEADRQQLLIIQHGIEQARRKEIKGEATKLLKSYMTKADELAKLTAQLLIMDKELDGEIFGSYGAFALMPPKVEPFAGQAEAKSYFLADCFESYTLAAAKAATRLRDEIAAIENASK